MEGLVANDPLWDYGLDDTNKDPQPSRATALRALLTTNTFAGASVGPSPKTSYQAWAFRALLKQPDAKEAFGELLKRGKLAGRLYALCGLYLLDRPAYDQAARAYAKGQEELGTAFGCFIGPMKLDQLIRRETGGGNLGDFVAPRRDAATPRGRRSRDHRAQDGNGGGTSACQRNVRESPEPVGADGERDHGATEPAGPGIAIGGQEFAVATDRFDARPLATSGNPRAQVAPGLQARGAGAPRLTEDRPPAQNTRAGSHALGGDSGFRGGDLRA